MREQKAFRGFTIWRAVAGWNIYKSDKRIAFVKRSKKSFVTMTPNYPYTVLYSGTFLECVRYARRVL